MKRTANPAPAPAPQLELPFGRQAAAHDLAYYIGLCKIFAAHHKRWPSADSTREEFRAARIPEYDGRRIDRELRFPGPELEADPAYQALLARRLADRAGHGEGDGVDLAALDPRYRTILQPGDIAALFDTITLPGRAGAGALRYATGAPAHAHGELTLNLGDGLRARALLRAGLDPDDARVLARAFSVRVHATDELKAIIDRIGVRHLHMQDRLADYYRLEAADEGRLDIRYQVLAGARYAGEFEVEPLVDKLASVYTRDPGLAALRTAAPPARPAAGTMASAPAPQGADELREQLAMLAPEGHRLTLPIQRLSRFDDIRRMLEKSGGLYLAHRQQFEFEDGVDAAELLRRLVSGAAA